MVDVIGVLKNQEQFAADAAKAEGKAAPTRIELAVLAPEQRQAPRRHQAHRRRVQPGRYGDDGRARYLQAIDGMTFGESREQGVMRGRNFYHEPLGIALTAPQGWKIAEHAPRRSRVVNARRRRRPDGEAGAAQGRHARTTQIIRNVFKPVARRAPSSARSMAWRPRISSARGATRRDSAQADRGHASSAGRRSPLLAAVCGARRRGTMQRAAPRLRETESSFRAMTAADRAAARPWTLKTVPFPRGGFAELARRRRCPRARSSSCACSTACTAAAASRSRGSR